MKLAYSEADNAFRQEVRGFLRDNLPAELAAEEARHSHLRRDKTDAWQRVLATKGWAVANWPIAAGGPDWTPVQRHIWDIEYGRANAPEYNIIGVGMVGPVIAAFGSDEQKRRFLGEIVNGNLHFCQGFSEPGAGSDLASLKTRAERDGDHYVISGQKTWTSHAADADYMICLARTRFDGKPQAGLSMLLVPMEAPGITVRPIPSIDGIESVNEVFLDEVRVPADALIGEQDKGWTYAKYLLTAERTHNAYLGMLYRYLDRLRAVKAASDAFRRKVAMLAIDIEALEWSVLRVHARDDEALGGATASALKVTASELLLRASTMEVDALGPSAVVETVGDGNALASWMKREAEGKLSQLLYWRAASVFGGTNEIQRTIIWSMLSR